MKKTIKIKGQRVEMETKPSSLDGWIEATATIDGVIVNSIEQGGSEEEALRDLQSAVHKRYCGCADVYCSDRDAVMVAFENPGVGSGLVHEHELDDGTTISFTVQYVEDGIDSEGLPIAYATHVGVCWAYRPDAEGAWVKLPMAEAMELARANLPEIEELFVNDGADQAELRAEG